MVKFWGRCSGKLWLELTNFAPNETTEIVANLRGISAKWAVGETLTASKLDTANSFDGPNMVVPKPVAGKLQDNKLSLKLEPKSVTVISFEQ